MEVPIESCVSAKVYKPDSFRRLMLTAALVALYAISLPYCYFTAGEPRRIAMIQAQKLSDEKWALETSSADESVNSTVIMDWEPIPATPSSQQSLDDFSDNLEDNTKISNAESQSSSWIMSWFGPSKEQRRAKSEFDKWQKELKEKSGDVISLPPEYLPSAWACLALFATLSLHALFHLMCHWVVAFKAASLFQPATKVEEGNFVLVVPPPNRGHAALAEVKKGNAHLSSQLFIEFQRQRYIYSPSLKLGDQAKKYPHGIFTLSGYPVGLPLSDYSSSQGITSDVELQKLTEKWGKNHLAVAIPSFLELLQAQLVSPLAIFQVFCALLWLLDEYWSYTFFSLVSVVIYEATTVFQRTRTQQMLGGMAPKPSPIYVYRCKKWMVITTKDLLPGDIISLSFKKRSVGRPNLIAPAAASTGQPADNAQSEHDEKKTPITSKDDVIPCDCLLIRGSAVVNEASLTGESVPQMKEAIVSSSGEEEEEKLDMMGPHRVHVLFSGCSIVTVNGQNKKSDNTQTEEMSSIPNPPDNGALAYVLRTGFGSSQGGLLQMIEFSQQSVSGNSRETGLALLLLFIFALMASGYVLKEGLRKQEKTTHEILLRCVIIITSVVPRQFPMQVRMATAHVVDVML